MPVTTYPIPVVSSQPESALGVYESKLTMTATGPVTLVDVSLASFIDITLTVNTEIVFTGALTTDQVGSVTLLLRQDATGGRTVTYRSSVRWPSGTVPVLTTTPTRGDLLVFSSLDGGNAWLGKMAEANLRLGFVTPALVQQNSAILTAGAETISVTLGSTPAQGNLLVAMGQRAPGASTSLSVDNFTDDVRRTGGASALGVGIWHRIAGASESATVTMRLPSGNTGLMQLAVFEVSGIDPVPLDEVAEAESLGATVTTQECGTTDTLVQTPEFAVAILGTSTDATFTNAWTNGFVRQTNNTRLTTASKVTSSKAAVNTAESMSPGRIAAGAIATFRAAVA